MGLWISRELATAMGGALTVRSELGAGSTFKLELPINTAQKAAQKAAQKRGNVPALSVN